MIFIAATLVIVGVLVALLGERMFRVILPIIGFVAGILIGYSGVEAIFGIGFISFPLAILTSLLIGAILAILSYLYFEIAIVLLVGVITGYGAMYIGIALGLSSNRFWLGLLTFAGAIIGLALATAIPMGQSLIVIASSFYGVAMVMAGFFMIGGSITFEQIQRTGILRVVTDRIDGSLLWFAVWVGGSIACCYAQLAAIARELLSGNGLSYSETLVYQSKGGK
ncbi:MAG: hypothetical protein QG549_617 [Patescibacteria group bacterium]|nr:hypothetical protein [Patescibacteria group bacterium]